MVNEFVRLGACFSFSGYFMNNRKNKLWDVFRAVPLERLLIETDSPDMCPPVERNAYPLADNLNHPLNLVSIYEFVADLREMEMKEFSEQMERNFKKLFGGVLR
jgi:TatD DNase family protein